MRSTSGQQTRRLPKVVRRSRRRLLMASVLSWIVPLLLLAAAIGIGGGYLWTSGVLDRLDDARPARANVTQQSRVAFVTDDEVNLRGGSSTGSDVLTTMSKGQSVEVTGAATNGFLPVAVGGRDGWISADYVNEIQPSDPQAAMADVAASGPVADVDPDPPAGQVESDGAPAVDIPVSPGVDADAETAGDVAVTEGSAAVVDGGAADWSGANGDEDQVPASDEVPALADDSTAPADSVTVDADDTYSSGGDQVVAAPGEAWIDVNRSTATITLYIGTEVQSVFQGKIGRDPAPDGFYSTAVGTFHVFSMEKGLASTPFVEDVYMTDWVGFDPDRKNGFHSPVREADGSERVNQNATTMGCVRLSAADAVTLFNFAYIGMRVEIHD